jgi:hypothetical protein
MKYIKLFLFALGFAALAAPQVYAQYPEDFSKDQADSTISFRRQEITQLNTDLGAANDAVTKANTDLQQRIADNGKCRDDLYAMLGSDRNGYNAYRERLARAEQELSALRAMQPASLNESVGRVNALETEIRALRGDKLVLIRDNNARVSSLSQGFIQLKQSMAPPVAANGTYTVGTWARDRDCLWNIAKKPDIYNDPFAWPKIWRANMETIHNPDLIYPGQQLTIMHSTVTQEDRDATGYRHRKH